MRRWILVLMIAALALPLVAQTKEARDKYQSALRARDPLKAERLLKESIAADPTWLKPQLELGGLYSALRRWEDASNTLAKVRDLDNQQKKLTEEERRHALDALGVAQAQARKYDEAIKTYTAALKDDPEYPLYEYNLSRTFAEKGDLKSALPHLKRAWELKDNLPRGTRFPDPRKDNSFRQYWSDQRFLDAVENMVI
jgi:tetratricopeptide (TPR) repeat protein